MLKHLTVIAVVSFLLVFAPTNMASGIDSYSEVYVFGDSASDNGNVGSLIPFRETDPYADLDFLVPSLPYDLSNQFSNGDVWTDMIGLLPSLDSGTNFAYGGAESGPLPGVDPIPGEVSILQQVIDQFIPSLGGASAPSDALYVVAPVGNDLRRALEVYLLVLEATGNPDSASNAAGETLVAAVSNVVSIVDILVREGAEDFLVFSGVDIGLVPTVTLLDSLSPLVPISTIAKNLAASYNAFLNQALDLLALDIARLDLFALLNSIVADPGEFGLINVTDSCITPGVSVCSNPDEFLFWDGIHLTTAGQMILADAVRAAVPVPATLALLVLGVGGIGYQRCQKNLGTRGAVQAN